MRALRYFVEEAAASLWRGKQAALLSILTIAAGLFVLGFFLVVQANLQRVTAQWGDAAELTVYLRDDATPDQIEAIRGQLRASGIAADERHVSRTEAAERFKQDFPELAGTVDRLERHPFPASIDVRLQPAAAADERADALVRTLASAAGVADVQYDRRWLERLERLIRFVRAIGLTIVSLLALAAALTVANVVRLAAHARRDEIEIMQLVGAPFTYVRGPLVLEGILQGGAGALVAIAALATLLGAMRARYGTAAADMLGGTALTFLPGQLWAVLLLGGMLLGCLGGLIVARSVR